MMTMKMRRTKRRPQNPSPSRRRASERGLVVF
jgi:hypothetical protein